MADILIRDLPDEVVAALDGNASRLGLSRNEYLRRQLAHDVSVNRGVTSKQDWSDFAGRFADLADPQTMDDAWR
ncbi:MAG: antitoxin [Actinomycetes bacterium]